MNNIVQIEQMNAALIMERFERIENALAELTKSKANDKGGDDLLTREEVAKLLNISLMTVHAWTNEGVLIAYKIGRRVYYKRQEVENALTRKGAKYARKTV